MLHVFGVDALAQDNFGLYIKIHEDSESSTYELIWSDNDPAVSQEPLQPGDFPVSTGGHWGGCSGIFPDPGLCPVGAELGSATQDSSDGMDDEMDRIVVVAPPRPNHEIIWVWETSFNGSGGLMGRDALVGMSGPAGYGISVLPRNPNGDDSVNCSSIVEVREAEASVQVGPHLLTLREGQPVRIQYGNGQTEIFIIECKICSLPAIAVAGTCS